MQRAVLASPANWLEVFRAFDEYQGDGNKKVAEKLFSQWRDRTVADCAHYTQKDQRAEDSWVCWLILARRDPSAHKSDLLNHLETWFECFQKHGAFFEKQWRSLALLTRVLPGASEFQKRCPSFHERVLAPNRVGEELEKSLQEAVAFLALEPGQIDPAGIWHKYLHTLVTEPGANGSHYREQALWMRALSEINHAAYDKLLSEWRVTHGRRRNLWSEMTAQKLPGV